jgi:hypothetical protein
LIVCLISNDNKGEFIHNNNKMDSYSAPVLITAADGTEFVQITITHNLPVQVTPPPTTIAYTQVQVQDQLTQATAALTAVQTANATALAAAQAKVDAAQAMMDLF